MGELLSSQGRTPHRAPGRPEWMAGFDLPRSYDGWRSIERSSCGRRRILALKIAARDPQPPHQGVQRGARHIVMDGCRADHAAGLPKNANDTRAFDLCERGGGRRLSVMFRLSRYGGRSCASSMSRAAIIAAWPMTFSSSRTFPGQECLESRICARWVMPRRSFYTAWRSA
jgi:hypothetical protein